MRHVVILMVAASVMVSVGCESVVKDNNKNRDFNRTLVRTYNDMALTNAIVRQHTLYGYHFVPESVSLNALGERDLGVLAAHYAKAPGTLTVDDGGVSAELYAARVAGVEASLAEQGVDVEAMKVGPGMPGGDGKSSEEVLAAQKKASEKRSGQALTITTGGGSVD